MCGDAAKGSDVGNLLCGCLPEIGPCICAKFVVDVSVLVNSLLSCSALWHETSNIRLG